MTMNGLNPELRVLAIDPTSRGFGFVVMEGPHRLVDYGIKSIRPLSNAACLKKVAAQIRFFEPEYVVLENTKNKSRRCKRVQDLIESIRKLASKAKVRTRLISRHEMEEVFRPSGARTKLQVAEIISKQLPELASRMPRHRKAWMSEDGRINIFDAVALALVFFSLRTRGRREAASSA